jgi:hypothetical protein
LTSTRRLKAGRARSITRDYAVVTGRVDGGFERSGSATAIAA